VLRRDGSFWHEGVRVTHPRLHAAFRAGVRWSEPERTFVVQLGRFRGWLDVEDTAFFVDAWDAATGELELSDRTREPLDPSTLRTDPDDALRCTVKHRFDARFTRAAQEQLAAALEQEGEHLVLVVRNQRLRLPNLVP
jgi:hypothetical protein